VSAPQHNTPLLTTNVKPSDCHICQCGQCNRWPHE